MSAFIVSRTTMDYTITLVQQITRAVGDDRFGGHPAFAGTAIGRELYHMNLEAIHSRYGGVGPLPGPVDTSDILDDYNYRYPVKYTKIRGLKAARCLLYQCTEGIVPDTNLFKELDQLADYTASDIIASLPAYRDAPWDFKEENVSLTSIMLREGA